MGDFFFKSVTKFVRNLKNIWQNSKFPLLVPGRPPVGRREACRPRGGRRGPIGHGEADRPPVGLWVADRPPVGRGEADRGLSASRRPTGPWIRQTPSSSSSLPRFLSSLSLIFLTRIFPPFDLLHSPPIFRLNPLKR